MFRIERIWMVNHTRLKIRVWKKTILHMQCARQSWKVTKFNALGHSVVCIFKMASLLATNCNLIDLQFVFYVACLIKDFIPWILYLALLTSLHFFNFLVAEEKRRNVGWQYVNRSLQHAVESWHTVIIIIIQIAVIFLVSMVALLLTYKIWWLKKYIEN